MTPDVSSRIGTFPKRTTKPFYWDTVEPVINRWLVDPLLTLEEVSRMTGVPKGTLKHALAARKILRSSEVNSQAARNTALASAAKNAARRQRTRVRERKPIPYVEIGCFASIFDLARSVTVNKEVLNRTVGVTRDGTKIQTRWQGHAPNEAVWWETVTGYSPKE